MNNKWKELWNKKSYIQNLNNLSPKDTLIELKKMNGFDVIEDVLTYESFIEQYYEIRKNLSIEVNDKSCLHSVFEVGCGSGANLFLFSIDGIEVGGIDYSESLIQCAKKVLPLKYHQNLIVGEATEIPLVKTYSVVLANSVFSYFTDEIYATEVLNKMLYIADYKIGLIDIHNIANKNDYLDYRKRNIKDYEVKYRDYPKLFYSKNFFIEYAKRNNLQVEFCNSNMKGYWNNEFVFDCYLSKINKSNSIGCVE